MLIHVGVILYVKHRFGFVPGLLKFGPLEFFILCFLIPPSVDASANLFKLGGQTAVFVGAILLLLVPVPVLVYAFALLWHFAISPSPILRGLFYEVIHPSRWAPESMEPSLWTRFIRTLAGKEELSGDWKAHQDDVVGTKWLSRSATLLAATRGPPVVRVNATFDLNPLTMRIDRGWLEPLSQHSPDPADTKSASVTADKLRGFNVVWKQGHIALVAMILGAMTTQQSIRQAGLLVGISVVDITWLLMLKPCSDSLDGIDSIFESVAMCITYSVVLALAIASEK